MSGAGMQTVREHCKKMWCRRTGALPQFSYGLVVVHGASPTVRLACGGAYGGGEGESRPHPKHQGRQVANTSACHVCIAQSDMGRPFLNSEHPLAPHSSPNPAFKTRSRELDTLPVQMWCSASSGVVMAPLRALPPAAHGTASSSRRIQRPVRLHASRLPTPVTHPHRLGSWTRRPLLPSHPHRSLASSVVPS